jgi:small GTP-binding protein
MVVGDGAVGKTCLIQTYTTHAFPGEYLPTVFDNFAKTTMVEDQEVDLQLWDTPGQPESYRLRPLSYPHTDVFLICFSLVRPTSLQNVQNEWVPEIKHHCPSTPYILVGTQSDLRDVVAANPDEWMMKGRQAVPQSSGEAMKKATGADLYIECSAKMQFQVEKVFEEAGRLALYPLGANNGRHDRDAPEPVSHRLCAGCLLL